MLPAIPLGQIGSRLGPIRIGHGGIPSLSSDFLAQALPVVNSLSLLSTTTPRHSISSEKSPSTQNSYRTSIATHSGAMVSSMIVVRQSFDRLPDDSAYTFDRRRVENGFVIPWNAMYIHMGCNSRPA
jgi:hypothetical protein